MAYISRRSFLKLGVVAGVAGAVGISGLPGIRAAFGVEGDDQVVLTEDMACDVIERYSRELSGDGTVSVQNLTKVYNPAGQATGYLADLNGSTFNHGYMIIDSTIDGLLSEYSFEEGSKSPLEVIRSSLPLTRAIGDEKLYKMNSVRYAVYDSQSKDGVDNFGRAISEDEIDNGFVTKSSSLDHLDDVTVSADALYRNYTIVSQASVGPWTNYSERIYKQYCGRYCCVVQASIGAMTFFVPQHLGLTNLKTIEQYMWDKCGVYLNEDGAYVASYETAGPAVSAYCNTQGKSVSYSFQNGPSFAKFKSHIDGWGICILGEQLSGTKGAVGHSMVCSGYIVARSKDNLLDGMNILEVDDGWYDAGRRMINFKPSDYKVLNGTFLS